MEQIASNVKFGNTPPHYFSFSYDRRRSGRSPVKENHLQQYAFKIECAPYTDTECPYAIWVEIDVAGSKQEPFLFKASSTKTWSKTISYTTGFDYSVEASTGATPVKIRVYSANADGSTKTTATFSYTLAVDPGPSKIVATDANIGSVSTINITRYDSSFKHTVTFAGHGVGQYSGVIFTLFEKQDLTTYGFEIPEQFYQLIPEEKTALVQIKCRTYSGDTYIGMTEYHITVTASEDKCRPLLGVSSYDINENTVALTGDNKKIVRFYSDLRVDVSPEAQNSAYIVSTSRKCGAETETDEYGTFYNTESAAVSATTTDSRGYSTTVEDTSLELIPYVKLTANTTVARAVTDGDTVNVTTKGNYFNGSFGAVDNTLVAEIRYRLKSETEFTVAYAPMDITITGNTYTATATLTGLDLQNDYYIRVRVKDAIHQYGGPLEEPKYTNLTLKKSIPVFDWGENDIQFNVPARFRAAADATESGNENVAIRTGPDDGQHLDIDTNEIIAKKSETEPGDFHLGGANVYLRANAKRVFSATETETISAVPLSLPQGYAIGAQGTGVKIYAGHLAITPTEANTPTSAYVEFPSGYFSGTPEIFLTVNSSVPERCSVGCTTDGKAGMNVYLTRNNTSQTRIYYLCIGT